MNLKDHLIVALDTDSLQGALSLVDTLGDRVHYYKVGSYLHTRYGQEIIYELASRDKEIFLDLKYHDIPSVVGKTVSSLQELPNVFMTTIHADGGPEMMKAASENASDVSVVAVIMLTSDDMSRYEIRTEYLRKGRCAFREGNVDGVVCAASDLDFLSKNYSSRCLPEDPIYVTPGIRLPFSEVEDDDQSRISTPEQTLQEGSSYLVIGRPIYESDNPVEVVDRIAHSVEELE